MVGCLWPTQSRLVARRRPGNAEDPGGRGGRHWARLHAARGALHRGADPRGGKNQGFEEWGAFWKPLSTTKNKQTTYLGISGKDVV